MRQSYRIDQPLINQWISRIQIQRIAIQVEIACEQPLVRTTSGSNS